MLNQNQIDALSEEDRLKIVWPENTVFDGQTLRVGEVRSWGCVGEATANGHDGWFPIRVSFENLTQL